ncbi:hypothetical protein [Teredinibacter franksiae]|uniref:hypothetical protein n=1 Tax=Teredinibacter franksiae TaxID=2761453 RepID=UPI0016264571|nr:hypothetical protein [Teredinibacter franksiae]
MPKQFIKGTDNKPFEIVEDDHNKTPATDTTPNKHRYDQQLARVTKATHTAVKKR